MPSDANRNHIRNTARRSRGRFHPRNARVPQLTPFETFEHDISFHDSYATSEATKDTDNIDASENESEEASSKIMLTPSPKIGVNSPSVSDEPRVMHIEFTDTAAGRNPSRNVARRARPSPLPRNALVNLTPFIRGETFNGFAKNLELEEIVGFSYETDEMILCDVKWRNDGNRIRRIESSLLRKYCPGMLADFYEKLILKSISECNTCNKFFSK